MESVSTIVSEAVGGFAWKTLTLNVALRVAVIILVGIVVIRITRKILNRVLARSKTVAAIQGYIRSMVNIGLWSVLALMVASSLGIDVTSLIALLSVAGLAVSLALQNTLSNLAGGIMILVSKPFAVADYVETDGVSGTVTEIGLAYSKLVTMDNKEIMIPNSQIAAAKVTNYTKLGRRRVEWTVSAAYSAPAELVRTAVLEVLTAAPLIQQDPAPGVFVSAYRSNSVEYVIRAWTAAGDYLDVYYAVLEEIHTAFQRHGVEMTYDHLNVHIAKE